MGLVPDLRTISGEALRAVSDGAIDQLAGRFAGLPRPLLAAIGAGDLAVEHLAVLREMAREQVAGLPVDGDEVVAAAAGVAASVQHFAGELPGRLQGLAAELPGRVAALTRATGELDPAAVRSTLEAYTEAAGVIYGGLARRGDRIWSDVRSASSRPGTVVEATADRAAGTVRVATAPAPVPAERPGVTRPAAVRRSRPRATSAAAPVSVAAPAKAVPRRSAAKPATATAAAAPTRAKKAAASTAPAAPGRSGKTARAAAAAVADASPPRTPSPSRKPAPASTPAPVAVPPPRKTASRQAATKAAAPRTPAPRTTKTRGRRTPS
ncbi:hypothetical protein FDO65_13395 [Nakamurella flava]|uniref:Uncharacterized protein n=1 Tax=Nakamurella flava TaxID=2576308 RepID=A0A4U6QER2_9ACTN|nr:hypothetical protein [Nakamurella flava]TKV58538.1 hypothetical protein FDO65_13395 [Nakamurella flava]